MTAKSRQIELLSAFSADALAASPFHNRKWAVSAIESHSSSEDLKSSVRIYYLSRYIRSSQLERLLTHVPYICTGGDSHILTQDGSHYSMLGDARIAHSYLITNEERRLSRNKCIASLAKVYSVGGYRSQLQLLEKSEVFECVVVSGAGPQFEARYLDDQDFLITQALGLARLKEYAHFGEVPEKWDAVVNACKTGGDFVQISERCIFHAAGYLVSMRECTHLWLSAFNDSVQRTGCGKRGYFKMTAIGTGFFANVAGSHSNIGDLLMPLILQAVEDVLTARQYPHIGVLEFPDFSRERVFTPTKDNVNGVKLIGAPFKDVLDFSDEVKQQYVVGVLNPGDCFACVGNELEYGSVEAMLGNNTSIRTTQCYIWNELVLDDGKYVAVEI